MFEPSYGWELKSFLTRGVPPESASSTVIENEGLKAELAKLTNVSSQFPDKPTNYLRAMVYSRYPMNFKNEFLIDIGKNEGVSAGKAVMFGGILIGKIEKTFDDTALVETVFDSRFQTPVRIGAEGIDALFKGGSLPQVGLITLKSATANGDIIYSASPDFPYALAMGELGDAKVSQDQLFREAPANFAYDINGIKTVLVAK